MVIGRRLVVKPLVLLCTLAKRTAMAIVTIPVAMVPTANPKTPGNILIESRWELIPQYFSSPTKKY
jgi:hypothetical protein